MNVVFVSYQPFPYGMAGSKRIRLFAEYLAVNNNVKVITIGADNGRNQKSGTLNNVDFEFIRFTRFESFLNRNKIQKILKTRHTKDVHNVLFLYDGIGLTNFLFAKIGKKLGFKVITDVVEDYSVQGENTGLLLSLLHKINNYFEKRTNRFADGVIVISTRLKKKFENLKIKKLQLITISAENLSIETKSTSNEQFTFLYSGSYGNKDGVDVLIDAFILFSKNNNVKLLLAGKINDRVSTLIKNEENILYVGLIPDAEYFHFLNKMDVLLMTRINSKYANAGFPFKLGEYLGSGKAVIATKVSDIELYLKDREDALLAEPDSVESLLKTFDFAINNKLLLKTIGENGKRKCELFFNPLINGKTLENFMKDLFVNA